MNLILYGFPGCGKSLCGLLAAHKLERTFTDTDEIVEELFFDPSNGRSKLSCRQIYRAYGEEYFRKLERDAVRRLGLLQRGIIATGGGAVLFTNCQELCKLGRLVYLKISKQTFKRRISSQADLPAFIDPYQLDESLERVYNTRLPVYERIADEVIEVDTLSPQQVADEICSLVAVQQG